MKRLIQTVKNIWKIEDLRFRIITTLWFVLIYRIGSYIVLPGIDAADLHDKMAGGGKGGGIMGLFDIFAGGAWNRASIFALGIMPYITASIIIQLLTMAVPFFQKLQKEGESGRRTLNSYTRVLTVAVCLFQSFGYYLYITKSLGAVVLVNEGMFRFSTMIILTAGTIFTMWMGEKIQDKGIGNGISLLIMVGIIARLPFALQQEFSSRVNDVGGGGLITFIIELAALLGVIVVTILLVQGTRKIPVNYAKRVVGNKQYGGVRQYVPLKVNAAGVMPIIFAQALMFIPATVMSVTNSGSAGDNVFTDHTSFVYNLIFSVLIVAFTYFYTALIINPIQMADEMKRQGGFIPGIKPGRKTADYIDSIMSKITLPGACFLAFVAIMPGFAAVFGVTSGFAAFFGGTSLLITVGVILDTLQQIESHLLMRHYDGLMKSGRIKGRTNVPTM